MYVEDIVNKLIKFVCEEQYILRSSKIKLYIQQVESIFE